VDVEGVAVDYTDAHVSGYFPGGGGEIIAGALDAWMDTRDIDELVEEGAPPGSACELFASLNVDCEECPDGSGPYCLHMIGGGMHGEQEIINWTHPETLEPGYGMLEISEEQVAEWIALGLC